MCATSPTPELLVFTMQSIEHEAERPNVTLRGRRADHSLPIAGIRHGPVAPTPAGRVRRDSHSLRSQQQRGPSHPVDLVPEQPTNQGSSGEGHSCGEHRIVVVHYIRRPDGINPCSSQNDTKGNASYSSQTRSNWAARLSCRARTSCWTATDLNEQPLPA